MQIIFGNVTKILLASFQKKFKAVAALESCHVTSSRQGVNENLRFSRFLEHISWNFHGSKILSFSCDKHQNYAYKCFRWPENEAQSPDFGHFVTNFGMFQAARFGTRTMIFCDNLIQSIYSFMCIKRFFNKNNHWAENQYNADQIFENSRKIGNLV